MNSKDIELDVKELLIKFITLNFPSIKSSIIKIKDKLYLPEHEEFEFGGVFFYRLTGGMVEVTEKKTNSYKLACDICLENVSDENPLMVIKPCWHYCCKSCVKSIKLCHHCRGSCDSTEIYTGKMRDSEKECMYNYKNDYFAYEKTKENHNAPGYTTLYMGKIDGFYTNSPLKCAEAILISEDLCSKLVLRILNTGSFKMSSKLLKIFLKE